MLNYYSLETGISTLMFDKHVTINIIGGFDKYWTLTSKFMQLLKSVA